MEQQREYVGIDLHRRRSVIVRITENGEVLETVRVDNDPLSFIRAVMHADPNPEVALEATYGWVRHEAPCDRVGGRAPPVGLSQQAAEAGGSLTSETRGRAGAASTTPGRAGTTRQLGPGKQDGEVYECRNQWWNPLKKSGPAGIWWMAGTAVRATPYDRGGQPRRPKRAPGGHGEVLRHSRGRPAGEKLGTDPVDRSVVNVGTVLGAPTCRPARSAAGKARRLLMAEGRGGGSVVVRGRESRPHGEGTQRARSSGTGMIRRTPVNTDAPWPDLDEAEARVLEIQTKLHQWAADDPHRRFDDLFNLVADPAFLVVAWDRVRGNRGARSAGVDGVAPRSIVLGERDVLAGAAR